MIAARLRECCDVDGVTRLFRELGYPVSPRPLGRDVLEGLGLTDSAFTLVHLVRYGGVDVYVAKPETDAERRCLRTLEDLLAETNHVIRPVIVELHGDDTARLAIHLRSGRSRRRLDVDTIHPSEDALDRICGLALRQQGAENADPGLLFERAVDREAVGRRFFEQFRKATHRIAEYLETASPNEDAGSCRDHALRLLSRILFIYLVQRKGWLDGDHRYLRERLAHSMSRGRSFHRSVLAPLFFDCLNKPVCRRPAVARKLGRIPYLNGGLFEPSAFEQRNRTVELPNETWRHVLDSVFEPFSLSVSESDEEGAHIDPEMLGKVFERLMEGDERARTGSFYTPRVVVDRLTSSAIAHWCGDGDADLTASLLSLLRGEGVRIDARQAPCVLRRLSGITILDPACGSGAFLLSALRTIESLTRGLMAIVGQRPAADLRAKIAAESLFGVDIKTEAVRLCELRIWLAIVSGSQHDADSVPPLPNLDRNVFQGNSLVGSMDFLAEGRAEIYRDWIRALRERETLTRAYRHASSTRRKRLAARLRSSDIALAKALLLRCRERDIEELAILRESDRGLFDGAPVLMRKTCADLECRVVEAGRLLERLGHDEVPFFGYELHFANVLARGGFSVVLGNPPWVRGSRVEPGLRRLLADRYESFRSSGSNRFRQTELAMAFVERSLSLAAPEGIIAQLVPSKMTGAEYASAARRELVSESSILELIDWSTEGRALFDADVFPLGLVAAKSKIARPIAVDSDGERFNVAVGDLDVGEAGSAWSTLCPDVRMVLRRIRERFPSLSDVLGRRPVMGVKTGANRRFFVAHVEVRQDGQVEVQGIVVPAAALVRTVRGRDLRRWSATDSTWMIWPPGLKGDHEVSARLASAIGVSPGALRLSYAKSEHLGLKVAWKDVSRGLRAAILPDQTAIGGVQFAVVPNQTLYSIDVATREEALILAALLNSTVVNALALECAERAKDHHWRYLATLIGRVPLPGLPTGDDRQTLVRLARRAELGDAVDRELNDIVARQYELDASELSILESFVRQRLGHVDGVV